MSAQKAVIIAARRTALGKIGGLHARRRIEALAAPVIKAVLADARVDPEIVDEVVIGNAIGGGGNPARLIALAAGLPETIPAITLDRQCASGLDAIVAGARMIETGAVSAVIAGGVESASTAPWRVAKPSNLYTGLPRFFSQPAFAPAEHGDPGMIEAAETVAREHRIGRERQDRFALESHRRAIEAADRGIFASEIVPMGASKSETFDEAPRRTLSPALLGRMPPLVSSNGTVTAGNSCQINDGAAGVLIVSEELHRQLGTPPGLVFDGAASAGIDPRRLGLAAISAATKLRERRGMNLREIDAIELNEAFAAQVLATADLLDLDEDRLNAFGGALAYGHPYGASGALLVVRLFTRLIREARETKTIKSGLAMIAAAGGVGTSALFRSILR